jgi:hypothetical protein
MEDAVFALKLTITKSGLLYLKAQLRQTLPRVKSSHRCKAIARGLGFRTYASLLSTIRSLGSVLVTADAAAFCKYLMEHGSDVPPRTFYIAVTPAAIRAVLEKVPKLTIRGIGLGEPRRKPDGKWETPNEWRATFITEQDALLSQVEPFLLSLAFLSKVKTTKTIRGGAGSYWIKHIAENYSCTYPEGDALGPQYVANGVLIAAAVHAGFNIKTHVGILGYDSLNVTFNMSKSSLIDLDCGVRPRGARAQERQHRLEQRNIRMLHTHHF